MSEKEIPDKPQSTPVQTSIIVTASLMDGPLSALKHAIKLGASNKSIVVCVDGWAEAEAMAKKIIMFAQRIILISSSAIVYLI